jgi:hypothetical protein
MKIARGMPRTKEAENLFNKEKNKILLNYKMI